MKNRLIIYICLLGVALVFGTLSGYAQQRDSLDYYLETAARNNPLVNSNFALYKASLERVPQAGAYSDMELDMGFFVNPMETLGGKQIADFTLMQMFPWFGTRKAARKEAVEMSRMSYELFRDAINNLFYEVKVQWYQLYNLNEQYKNTKLNIALLEQLEQLALNRFSTASISSSSNVAPPPVSTPTVESGGSSMSGMGSATKAESPSNSQSMSGMAEGAAGMKASVGGMSDVLRIQIEKMELENNLEVIASNLTVAEAQFNTLLNRNKSLKIAVPKSLEQLSFYMDDESAIDSIILRNPMLSMLSAEAKAYQAKAEMDKKMGYPMFGIGLQYSVLGKSNSEMVMQHMNGKDMLMPMITMSLPLFRKKYNAQRRESQYYRQSSELKYENTLNQLEAEYIAAKQQLANAIRKVNLYDKQYELSLLTYQLMIKEFAAGITPLTDVIQVERQLRDYSLKKSETIAEYNTAIAKVEKLIATPLND